MSTSSKPNGNTPAARPDPAAASEARGGTGPSASELAPSTPAKSTGHRLWLWVLIPLLFIIVGVIVDRLRGD